MKILALVGSPRKKLTYQLLRIFERQIMKIEEVDFEYLFLSDYSIDHCIGCEKCITLGSNKCNDFKNVLLIIKKMIEADGFIIGTPSFGDQIPGIFKTFLDHLCFVIHRPIFYDKYAILSCNSNGSGNKDILKYLDYTFNKMGVSIEGHYSVFKSRWVKENQEKKIFTLCKNLHEAISLKKYARPSFKALLHFQIMKNLNELIYKDLITVDYNYWNEKGWFDAEYYRRIDSKYFAKKMSSFIGKKMRKALIERNEKGITKILDASMLEVHYPEIFRGDSKTTHSKKFFSSIV